MKYILHGFADGQLVENAETWRYGFHERVEEVAGCSVATVEHRDVAELHLLERLHLLACNLLPLVHHLVLDSDGGVEFGGFHHCLEAVSLSQERHLLTLCLGFETHAYRLCLSLSLRQRSLCLRFSLAYHLLCHGVCLQDSLLLSHFRWHNLLCLQRRLHLQSLRLLHFLLRFLASGLHGSLRTRSSLASLLVGVCLSDGELGV